MHFILSRKRKLLVGVATNCLEHLIYMLNFQMKIFPNKTIGKGLVWVRVWLLVAMLLQR